MEFPTYVVIDGIEYDINTDFKSALECISIINNPEIDDYERAIAIVIILFGEECPINEASLNKAKRYLECSREITNNNQQKIDFDFEQDIGYVRSSFMSDYGIDLEDANIHWYSFFEKVESFTPDSIVSRIRDLRNFDLSEIKDAKTKKRIKKAQDNVAIKPKKIIKGKTKSKRDNFLKQLKK